MFQLRYRLKGEIELTRSAGEFGGSPGTQVELEDKYSFQTTMGNINMVVSRIGESLKASADSRAPQTGG